MATSVKDIQNTYPLPSYNFRVSILDHGAVAGVTNLATVKSVLRTVGFSKVSGLNIKREYSTYKHGLSYLTGPTTIPGQYKPIELTLEKGIIRGETTFTNWLNPNYDGILYLLFGGAKKDLLIELLDESGDPRVVWFVGGALPTSLDVPDFDANSNEVAIERLTVVAYTIWTQYLDL